MAKKSASRFLGLDTLKWLFVLVLIAAAVVGNVYFASQYSGAIRAIGIIVLVLVALLVAVTTVKGNRAWQFIKEARMEMRKVVWPTRQETVQSTLMVIAVVAITALILWGVDSVFALAISHVLI